jgi:hypothetical protein
MVLRIKYWKTAAGGENEADLQKARTVDDEEIPSVSCDSVTAASGDKQPKNESEDQQEPGVG